MPPDPTSPFASGLTVPPGLKGIAVAATSIGDVRGAEGFYHYRQYSATELASARTFEDVWELLVDGALPSDRRPFADEVRPLRVLPAAVSDALPAVTAASAPTAGPLDRLRTAVSLLAAGLGMQPLWDLDDRARRRDLLALVAATPTLVAAMWRLEGGKQPIEPDPALGHAANYLWMLSGQRPDAATTRALEQYLILTMDHGWNASTFTARVIASTGADAGAAATGAIGALSGPLHGGAPGRALEAIDAIGSPERAEAWIRAALERGERIMGFGHAVYRTRDPRSELLRAVAEAQGGALVELAVTIEQTITDLLGELRPDRPLYANVEYYAGVVMRGCGLDVGLFSPSFAVARMVGWSANIREQAESRTIIRPAARYVGPPPPVPVPALALSN